LPTVGTRATLIVNAPTAVARQWMVRQWVTRSSIPRRALVATTTSQARRLAGVTIDIPVRSAVHNTILEIDLTTELKTKPVLYVKYDGMGIRYAVPENEVDQFVYADEAIENAEWSSEERDALIDDFNARFGEYRKE